MLPNAQFLDHGTLVLWHTERCDDGAHNESEEIADLEGYCDQSDCQHHRSDAITVRNSDCGAQHRQTNRRKRITTLKRPLSVAPIKKRMAKVVGAMACPHMLVTGELPSTKCSVCDFRGPAV